MTLSFSISKVPELAGLRCYGNCALEPVVTPNPQDTRAVGRARSSEQPEGLHLHRKPEPKQVLLEAASRVQPDALLFAFHRNSLAPTCRSGWRSGPQNRPGDRLAYN